VIPEPPTDLAAEQDALLEQLPHLRGADYSIESCSTLDYNCLAWAMGDCSQPWSPALQGGYYWPLDLPVGLPVVEVVVGLFRREGYDVCNDSALVPGAQKVALYADGFREVHHVARQLPTGRWASKLGDLADIEHATPEVIECDLYGRVVMILCRPINRPQQPPVRPRLIVPS
jgi:hypothetical protein